MSEINTGTGGSPADAVCYLQLMPAYAPSWGFGGPFRLMYDYAQGMKTRVSKVVVIAGNVHHDFGTVPEELPALQGVQLQRVHVFRRELVRRSIWLISPMMLLRAMWTILTFRGKVVVHFCEWRGLTPIYATVLRRLLGWKVRVIHSAFGMLHHKESRIREVYDRHVIAHNIRAIDMGLAQNQHELTCYGEFAQQHTPDRSLPVELFPLNIQPRPSPPTDETSRQSIRARHGIAQDCFVSIFLGRIHPEKGILRAIDTHQAFLAASGRACHLLIVGRDDGFQDAVVNYLAERGLSDSVTIVNDIYEERFAYYASADVFLGFPTIYEETMLASLEALSCGTPIIVSREADAPYVEDAGAGFVIDFSVERAVACMLAVLSSLAVFRENAVAAASRFSTESAIGRLEQLVQELSRTC